MLQALLHLHRLTTEDWHSDTKAGEAAASASAASTSEANADTSEANALTYSSNAATSAAAAASSAAGIAGYDLDVIAETKGVTAVDVFVYDTSKDSDGGAWRKRTQGTSWYNETLNTATRGARREFPAVAVIVAERPRSRFTMVMILRCLCGWCLMLELTIQ